MASPFSIFRKNQKAMLAVITLMAMFAFVFIPIIMQGMGGRSSANPVVAKTSKFGNLTRGDLQYMGSNHLKVLEVLSQLAAMGAKAEIAAAQASGKISADQAAMATLRYGPEAFRRQFEDESNFGPANPENLVNSWLLARSAEQAGMVISDDMVKEYIKGITRDAVGPADIRKVLDHAGLGDRQFLSLLHDELLAQQFREEFRVSLFATTPGQRWDYFNRVKRMAAIEAVPVAVADYIKQVAEPKEEELKKFFEENKGRYPNPVSPEPGFRRPHKVAIEYFKADYEKLAASKAVTDADVQVYYEKNKDKYAQVLEELLKKEPVEKKEQKPAEKAQPKPAEKKDQKPAEKTSQKPPEKKDQKPAERSEKKKDSKSASSEVFPRPNVGQVADLSHGSPHPKPLPKGEGAVVRPSPFILASLVEEKKASQKTQPPPAVKKSEPPKTATPPVPAEKKEKKAEPSKPVLPEALKRLIRQVIARERILEIFDGLRGQMDEYGQKWSEYDVERITSQGAAGGGQQQLGSPPPRLDFEKLAKQHGLVAGHTDLVAQWQAEATEIGASKQVTFTTDDKGERHMSGGLPVARYAYQSLSTFRPANSLDDHCLYLFWKTEDEKEHMPKFDDEGVREEVLQAWKMIHARDLARRQAKSLADEATKANGPLKQVFAKRPDLRVVLPPKFSWMTFEHEDLAAIETLRLARLSDVAGVEMAGAEFMHAVFGLEKPGQTAVAFNAPRTVAYVVQLTEFSPAYEVRKSLFEVDDFSKYAAVAMEDQRRTYQAWLKEIRASAGFEWMPDHDPNRPTESGERPEPGRFPEPDQSGE